MRQVRNAGIVLLSATMALLAGATQAHSQERGRGGNQSEPPTLRGKVVAYEADRSITVETTARGGETRKTEFLIVKDKTLVELGAGVKAIEPGATVSVWAEKDNPENAAKIAAQGIAPEGRNRGAAPAAKVESAKPAVATTAPKIEGPADAKKILGAYESVKKECDLRIYQLRWAPSLKEAKERAARENRPVLISASGNMHANTFTGHT